MCQDKYLILQEWHRGEVIFLLYYRRFGYTKLRGLLRDLATCAEPVEAGDNYLDTEGTGFT